MKITQEWQGNDYVMSVSGLMRETVVFGENLTLTRTVSTKLGEKRFWIHDNRDQRGLQGKPSINCSITATSDGLPWTPALNSSRPAAWSPRATKWPWTARRTGGNSIPPSTTTRRKSTTHDMAADRKGNVTVAIVNDGFKKKGEAFGVYITYNKNELPRFVEWKQMGEQDYVVGFEPCNCGVEGRAVDEKQGLLHALKPGESQHIHLEFGAVTEKKEVDALKAARNKVKTTMVDSYKQFRQKAQVERL